MSVDQHEACDNGSNEQPEELSELEQLIARMHDEVASERMQYLRGRHPDLRDATLEELNKAEHELVAQEITRLQQQFGTMKELPWSS